MGDYLCKIGTVHQGHNGTFNDTRGEFGGA